jgi:hypothetical protein
MIVTDVTSDRREVWIPSLSQKLTSKINTRPNNKGKGKRNHRRQNLTKKVMKAVANAFSHAAEGSDAESRSVMKWCGVPHWENQPACIGGSIDPDLVGLDDLERHP